MNKQKLVQAIRDHLQKELDITTQSALAAHAEATHPDSKAENKYDTRGLEASYLAGAQAERAAGIQATLVAYQFLDLKSFTNDTPIAATALVQLEESGKKSYYFLSPHGGGFSIEHEGHSIFIIGPQAPLSMQLFGCVVGDAFEMKMKGGIKEYEVVGVE